jgi:hypothetical protein
MIIPLLAALLLPIFAHAADPIGVPVGDSDWIEADPKQSHPEDPGSVDRDRFREGFQNRTLDSICRLVQISADLKLNPLGFVGIQIGAHRSLRRYADGKLALVDEQPVKLSLGYSQELVKLSDKATTGAFFSASFDGRSTVILPLKDSSCKALKTVLNPLRLKSIMPLSGFKDLAKRRDFSRKMAERIMAMEQDEVWKLPVKPTVGWGPSVTVPVGEASFSAHWTFSTSRGESVTLKRLGPTQVRYRFRIDSVKITDKGAGVSGAITAADMGVEGKFVYSQLVGLFNQYFRANIAANAVKANGREIILEYVLDPTDPAQMEALVRAAVGDISVLDTVKNMIRRTDKLLAGDEDTREGLERLRDEHDEKLDSEATFAAGDVYQRPSENFHLHIPFLFRLDAERSDAGRERIVLLDEKGGEIHLFPAQARLARGFADVPVLGDLDRFEKSSGVQVYTYQDKNGTRDTANAVFIEQRAFTREGPWTPNGMLESVNGVMRYAGMRGAGVDARKELPLPAFPSKDEHAVVSHSPKGIDSTHPILYEKGMSAFTLILSRKAIQDILRTGPDDVRAACAGALKEAKRPGALEKIVSGVVRDLQAARDAGNPEAQAKAFRDILAGGGRSGLAYADILKVLVQFADPADIAGIVDIEVRGGRNDDRLRKRFILNKDGADSELVRSYAAARARFLEPAITSD